MIRRWILTCACVTECVVPARRGGQSNPCARSPAPTAPWRTWVVCCTMTPARSMSVGGCGASSCFPNDADAATVEAPTRVARRSLVSRLCAGRPAPQRRSHDMRRIVSWPRPSGEPDAALDGGDHPADLVIAACPACSTQFAPAWDFCMRCGRNLHRPFTTRHKLRHALRWFLWVPLMRKWPIGYVIETCAHQTPADGACSLGPPRSPPVTECSRQFSCGSVAVL
jgi:hypothetical protein